MAIQKLDFTRGQVVNPLDSIGDDLLKYGASLHQQEKDRLAAIRQDELLNMQRAEHQMKVDAVAQAAKEKEAANKYADALGAATSGNVIGMPDQKAVGERVALLGSQADAARLAGDTATQNKLIAEQQSYINSVLPKMTKAYEASPEAQLQVLRGANPLGGTADLAPQTRLALLKEAEAPIEKTLDRRLTHEDKIAEIKEADKLAARRQQLGFTHAENLQKTANEKENERTKIWMSKETYVNAKDELIPGNIYMGLKPEEQKEWVNTGAKKDLLTPKADKTYGVVNDNGIYRSPKEGEKPTEFVEASVFNKIINSDEKSTGSALAKTLSDFSSGGMFSTDHKAAATGAANEAGKLLNAGNVPLPKANSIINAAVLAAKDKEGTFNKEVFDLAIQQGMLSNGVAKGKKDESTLITDKQVLKSPVVTADEKARFDVLSGVSDKSIVEQKEFQDLEKRLSKIKAEEEKRKIKADQIANIDRILHLKPQDRTAEDMRILTEGY